LNDTASCLLKVVGGRGTQLTVDNVQLAIISCVPLTLPENKLWSAAARRLCPGLTANMCFSESRFSFVWDGIFRSKNRFAKGKQIPFPSGH
jgi:hypothetical protein